MTYTKIVADASRNSVERTSTVLEKIKKMFSDLFSSRKYNFTRFYHAISLMIPVFNEDVSQLLRLAKKYATYLTLQQLKPTDYVRELSEDEKTAQSLNEMLIRNELEEIRYQTVLKNIYAEDQQKTYLDAATSILTSLKKQLEPIEWQALLCSQDKNKIESIILKLLRSNREKYDFLFQTIKNYRHDFNIQGRVVLDLCISRILVLGINQYLVPGIEKYRIAFLVPCCGEQNRLRKLSEIYTGEDFLLNKVRQLMFLFDGCEKLDWTLTFVEDEAVLYRGKTNKRTTDMIHDLIETDSFFNSIEIRQRIQLLTHDQLNEERNLYKDPKIANMAAEEFASKYSYKGGAVQVGLRYLAQSVKGKAYNQPLPKVIIVTDSDISTNIGHSGLLMSPIIVAEADIVIGSRRVGGAHVIGKTSVRKMISEGYNVLVRSLLNLQINDTQSGFKAFTTETIREIQSGFRELGMSFDAELLKCADMQGKLIKEVGMVWRDSTIESKSANQTKRMFQGLLRIYKSFYDVTDSDVITFDSLAHSRWIKEHEDSSRLITAIGMTCDLINIGKSSATSFDPYASELQIHMDKMQIETVKNIHQAMIFEKLTQSISNTQQFHSLITLASNPAWDFIVQNMDRILQWITPKEVKQFIEDFKKIILFLATGRISEDDFNKLFESAQEIVFYAKNSHLLGFVFKEFPQLVDILELFHKNPRYLAVIIPILLGRHSFAQVLSSISFESLYQFSKNENIPINSSMLWDQWVNGAAGHISSRNLYDFRKAHIAEGLVLNEAKRKIRIDSGFEALKVFNAKNIKITVSIVMQIDMDATTPQWVDDNLKGKFVRLLEKVGVLENISWKVVMVDSRPVRNSNIDKYVQSSLRELKERSKLFAAPVEIVFHALSEAGPLGKGAAIRTGLNLIATESDYVGFVDFSPKIDILELVHLLAKGLDAGKDHAIVIGSRRMEESEVVNKSVDFLIRSFGLNIIIKWLFPLLYPISDTQGGFKLFGANAWKKITNEPLVCNGLGFDVELLQTAANLGFPIIEEPIDFSDNTLDQRFDMSSFMISGVLDDVLVIRSRMNDEIITSLPRAAQEATLINGGAENIVFEINGKILKIPHERFDPDFYGLMNSLLNTTRKGVTVDDQSGKLISSTFMQKLLMSGAGKRIASLRDWKEFNIFVMKMFSIIENKDYRSVGYHIAKKVGKDLIVPYRFIVEPFSFSFNGTNYTVTAEDRAIQTEKIHQSFKEDLESLLQQNLDVTGRYSGGNEAIKAKIDRAMNILRSLWKRGLVDLDTNIMRDMGYLKNPETGTLQLMVTDPGEFIDSLAKIKPEYAKTQIQHRNDYKELNDLLDLYLLQIDKRQILSYFNELTELFFSEMQNDKIKGTISVETLIPSLETEKAIKFWKYLRFDVGLISFDTTLVYSKIKNLEFVNRIPDLIENSGLNFSKIEQEFLLRELERVILYTCNDMQFRRDFIVDNDFSMIEPEKIKVVDSIGNEKNERLSRATALKQAAAAYQPPFWDKETNPNAGLPTSFDDETMLAYAKHVRTIPLVDKADIGRKDLGNDKTETRIHTPYGSFAPVLRVLSNHGYIFKTSTDSIILDSGMGVRSSLIGLAAGTKGKIMLQGVAAHQRIAASLKQLNMELAADATAKNELGYIIMSASDNLMEFTDEQVHRILKYFSEPKSPGYFHYDLPEAGSKILPQTRQAIADYAKDYSIIKSVTRRLLNEIPITKGFSLQHVDNMNRSGLMVDALTQAQHFRNKPEFSKSSENSLFSFLPHEVYAQFLIYNACLQYGGLKTPYLFVFKKQFLQELKQSSIMEYVKPYLAADITWHNFLVNGMKADNAVWATRKPQLVNFKDWEAVRKEIKAFGQSQNVDYEDAAQNKARVFDGNWQFFEDPLSLADIASSYVVKDAQGIKRDIMSQSGSFSGALDSLDMMVLNSPELKGNVIVQAINPLANANEIATQGLFYNVELGEHKTLFVPPNHLVVSLSGTTYSTEMKRGSRSQLLDQSVYQYGENGQPEAYLNFKEFYKSQIKIKGDNKAKDASKS